MRYACIIHYSKSIGGISLWEFGSLNSVSRFISDPSWFKNNLLISDGDKGYTQIKASSDISGRRPGEERTFRKARWGTDRHPGGHCQTKPILILLLIRIHLYIWDIALLNVIQKVMARHLNLNRKNFERKWMNRLFEKDFESSRSEVSYLIKNS